MNMQNSYLSPPFGPAAFYLKGVAPPEISLQDIYKALWPFMLMQIAAIFLVHGLPRDRPLAAASAARRRVKGKCIRPRLPAVWR